MVSKIRGRVFGSLTAGEIKIHVAFGYGHNDGGDLRTFKTEQLPVECRIPNTYVWIIEDNGKVVSFQKMTASEIKENSPNQD